MNYNLTSGQGGVKKVENSEKSVRLKRCRGLKG